MSDLINLGNVVGLIRSYTEPTKKYVIWAHQTDPLNEDIITLKIYDFNISSWVIFAGINLPDGVNVNDVLIWDGVNYIPGSVTTSIPAGTDVNDTLIWNGLDWVIGSLPTDLPAGAATGDVLTWNGAAWISLPPSAGPGSITSVVGTFQDLLALINVADGAIIQTKGFVQEGDGGSAYYIVQSGATGNLYPNIKEVMDNNTQYVTLLHDGAFVAEQINVNRNNSATKNATNLNTLATYFEAEIAYTSISIYFNAQVYEIETVAGFKTKFKGTITFQGAGTTFSIGNNTSGILINQSYNGSSRSQIDLIIGSVVVDNITFIGGEIQLGVYGTQNSLIANCHFNGAFNKGIDMAYCTVGEIENNLFSNFSIEALVVRDGLNTEYIPTSLEGGAITQLSDWNITGSQVESSNITISDNLFISPLNAISAITSLNNNGVIVSNNTITGLGMAFGIYVFNGTTHSNNFSIINLYLRGTQYDYSIFFDGEDGKKFLIDGIYQFNNGKIKIGSITTVREITRLPSTIVWSAGAYDKYKFIDRLDTPPLNPNSGDKYLIGVNPIGSWALNPEETATWNGLSWDITPFNTTVFGKDDDTLIRLVTLTQDSSVNPVAKTFNQFDPQAKNKFGPSTPYFTAEKDISEYLSHGLYVDYYTLTNSNTIPSFYPDNPYDWFNEFIPLRYFNAFGKTSGIQHIFNKFSASYWDIKSNNIEAIMTYVRNDFPNAVDGYVYYKSIYLDNLKVNATPNTFLKVQYPDTGEVILGKTFADSTEVYLIITGIQTDSSTDPGTVRFDGEMWVLKDPNTINVNFGIIGGVDYLGNPIPNETLVVWEEDVNNNNGGWVQFVGPGVMAVRPYALGIYQNALYSNFNLDVWEVFSSGGGGQTLYSGSDTTANIKLLDAEVAAGNNEVWWSTDNFTEYVPVAAADAVKGVAYWQERGIQYKPSTETFVLPLTQFDSQIDIGEETIINIINGGNSSITETEPKLVLSNGNTLKTLYHTVDFARAGDIPDGGIIAVTTTEAVVGKEGKATVFGFVNKVNSTGSTYGETWLTNDILYAHPSISGGFTNIKPFINIRPVARVMTVDALNGSLFVSCMTTAKEDVALVPIGFDRIYFTGDEVTTGVGTFYTALVENRGTVLEQNETIQANDNSTVAFPEDWLTEIHITDLELQKDSKYAQIEYSCNTPQAQELLHIELYHCGPDGTVIDSGILNQNYDYLNNGVQTVGSLGVRPITVYNSARMNAPTGVGSIAFLTAFLLEDYIVPTGDRMRVRVMAEKFGAAGGNKTFNIYFGIDRNSFFETTQNISFLSLPDTPNAYTGNAGNALKVNATENGVEFVDETPTVIDLGNTSTALNVDLANGSFYKASANDNFTINFTNLSVGTIFIDITQTNGGGHVLTTGTNVVWGGGVEKLLSTTDGAIDTLICYSNGVTVKIEIGNSYA